MRHDQYVLPNDDTWVVRDVNGSGKTRSFVSWMDAMCFARTMAAKYRSQVIVFDDDMDIENIESYAKKPDPPE